MPDPTASDEIDAFLAPIAQAGAMAIAVMVSSVDGRTTIDGRVGGLTGEPDQRVLLGVREHSAAVVIGAGTAGAEGYDRLLDDEARGRRRSKGLSPEPELVVLTRSSAPVAEAWADLRARHPDSLIASEGGPTMLGVELELGLIDQLVICISPQLVGDNSQKRLIDHESALGISLELLDTASSADFVFLRYGIR